MSSEWLNNTWPRTIVRLLTPSPRRRAKPLPKEKANEIALPGISSRRRGCIGPNGGAPRDGPAVVQRFEVSAAAGHQDSRAGGIHAVERHEGVSARRPRASLGVGQRADPDR